MPVVRRSQAAHYEELRDIAQRRMLPLRKTATDAGVERAAQCDWRQQLTLAMMHGQVPCLSGNLVDITVFVPAEDQDPSAPKFSGSRYRTRASTSIPGSARAANVDAARFVRLLQRHNIAWDSFGMRNAGPQQERADLSAHIHRALQRGCSVIPLFVEWAYYQWQPLSVLEEGHMSAVVLQMDGPRLETLWWLNTGNTEWEQNTEVAMQQVAERVAGAMGIPATDVLRTIRTPAPPSYELQRAGYCQNWVFYLVYRVAAAGEHPEALFQRLLAMTPEQRQGEMLDFINGLHSISYPIQGVLHRK